MVLCVVCAACSESQKFKSNWSKANELATAENYEDAERLYNQCVQSMEEKPDLYDPNLLVDRGAFYLSCSKNVEALHDLNKAINSNHLHGEYQFRAYLNRMIVNAILGNLEQYEQDSIMFRQLNPNPLNVEFLDDYIVIHNIPDNEFQREMIRKFTLGYHVCDDEKDIQFDNSGNCRIKRKNSCCVKSAN
jgi:tetratricopeptide (TPR) repeat protein